ncbi:MAG: XdhC family protein, partial [Pseudomonadota bacterium]
RALVAATSPLPFRVTWIDDATDRFPPDIPPGVTRLVAADPVAAVGHAPGQARHIVLTYSHDRDLALCHAILARPEARLGLIGSATKKARFLKRLAALGHSPATLSRLVCPIGHPSLGKEPAAIALGVAFDLLEKERTGAWAGTEDA